MRKLITLLVFTVLTFSCGTLQNLTKKTEKETNDSSSTKSVDSVSVSKRSNTKDSSSVSNWGKEMIIEYFQDWVGAKDSLGAIIVNKQEVRIPKTRGIKSITVRERSTESARLIVGMQKQDSTKVLKNETAQTKSFKATTDREKVVSYRAKWPYIILALLLLALFIYLYCNKIKPPFV
jgi:hypothetical protein